MFQRSPLTGSLLGRLLGLLLALLAGQAAHAQGDIDPPGRVGRLAELAGPVWWFDLEQGRWAEGDRNRPLTSGDRVSTGRDARAEVRVGSTTLMLAEATEVEFLRLDDDQLRILLHRGSLALRLRSREVAAETVIGTDEAWLRPLRGGLYRLDRDDDTTHAGSWRGELQVEDDGTLIVDNGRRLQLWREGRTRELRHRWREPIDDTFAQRVLQADRDESRSASAAYVSPEMTGWEDLDRHGRWDRHPDFGAIWIPFGVGVDWVPYRDGRWAWVRPWGWTWIDNAPWGFAPFHYGRWVEWRARWVWVPGAYVPRPVFAPALVAWIDGPSVGIGLRIGGPTYSWMPLAPWEPFRPYYRASPRYHERIDPPDLRRRRPPPDWKPLPDYGRGGVPRGVTVVPADVLRQPQPLPPRRDEPPPPRPPRDRDRDGSRDNGREGGRDANRDHDRDRRPGPDRGTRPVGPALQPPAVVHPPVMSAPERRAPVTSPEPRAAEPRPPAAAPAEPPRPVMRPQPVRPVPQPEGRQGAPAPASPPPAATSPAPVREAPRAPPAAPRADRPDRADKPERSDPPPDRGNRDEGRARPEGRGSVR